MKKRKRLLLVTLGLLSLVVLLIVIGSMTLGATSIIRLSANPKADATACVHHPSPVTCTPHMSPFGTQQPGAPSCATQATIPALVALSDPSLNEAPIATLEVWQSPTCHAWFASASTSTLLGLSGPFTLTVSITSHPFWWQHALMETSVQHRGDDQMTRAWTPLLPSSGRPPETVEACLSITATAFYHMCTTVSREGP